jgi:hypothetical protein
MSNRMNKTNPSSQNGKESSKAPLEDIQESDEDSLDENCLVLWTKEKD